MLSPKVGGALCVAAVLASGVLASATIPVVKPEPPAFFVAEFTLHDAPAMKPYGAGVEATFKPFGGKFLARGGSVQSIEGSPVAGGIVIIRFDSLSKAQAWYGSAAYAPLKAIRQRAATTRAYIVTGTPS